MTTHVETTAQIEVYPATAGRWKDLEALFGVHGASEDCWCMFWRVRRKDFNKLSAEERKATLNDMTMDDKIPGLLAYVDGEVAGWCSMAAREQYQALENSRKLKRIDDKPVWSIVCFYISKAYRFHGLMDALLGAADRLWPASWGKNPRSLPHRYAITEAGWEKADR